MRRTRIGSHARSYGCSSRCSSTIHRSRTSEASNRWGPAAWSSTSHRCPSSSYPRCLASSTLILQSSGILGLERVAQFRDTRQIGTSQPVSSWEHFDGLKLVRETKRKRRLKETDPSLEDSAQRCRPVQEAQFDITGMLRVDRKAVCTPSGMGKHIILERTLYEDMSGWIL